METISPTNEILIYASSFEFALAIVIPLLIPGLCTTLFT